MEDFTFITLSYNHEKYILQHLESIKHQILEFGDGMVFDYILSDDCSNDNTVKLVNEWLQINHGLFRNVTVLQRKENKGVVNSVFEAVGSAKTELGKYLAADDYFGVKNIFTAIKDNCLTITPVEVIGADKSIDKGLEQRFNCLLTCRKDGDYEELIKIDNFIPAPGAFFPFSFIKDQQLVSFMEGYRNIEDYPMFYHFVVKKRYPINVLCEKYVCYRVGEGISTTKKTSTAYSNESNYMHKHLNNEIYLKNKYLCKSWYKLQLIKLKSMFVKR